MTAILTDRERGALADATGRFDAVAPDRFVPALTGVRAFAAFWVVVHHLWLNAHAPPLRILGVDLSPLFAAGWLGVDVFFVLSGFLLTQQAIADDRRRGARAGRAPGYGAFLTRRILRVFPAYYACLTALILFPAFRGEPYVPAPTTPDLALHLAMMHNAVSAYLPTINGVFWSLPFEFQFYLVMPFLALAVLRGRTGTLLALAVATSLAARAVVVASGSGRMLELLPFRIDEFVFGMAAAAFAAGPRAARYRGAIFWAGLALLSAMAAYFGARRIPWWTPDLWPTIRTWCVAGGTALMLAGLARGARTGTRVLGHPAIVWLGEISYSIYLWHLPVLVYLYQHVAWFDRLRAVPLARPLAAVGAVVAVSAASYYVVERPFHSGVLGARRLGRAVWIAFAILAAWALALLALNAA